MGQKAGCTAKVLARLAREGSLRRPLRNVYVPAHLADTIELRARTLSLVVPADAFVCDRTAGWLHGAPGALAPNEHLVVPPVSCFIPSSGRRVRNAITESGEREMRSSDLMEVYGVRVTTPLRTALDLGRLQPTRDLRLAGMDAMARLGVFTLDELLAEVPRFAKQRGVVLLRALAPLVDAGAQSPGESALRLRWYDAGLPRPRTQVPFMLPSGRTGYLDIGLEEWLFGAEYDSEDWHSTAEQVEYDAGRREFASLRQAWVIEVFRKRHVYGHHQNADLVLREAFARAQASYRRRITILL